MNLLKTDGAISVPDEIDRQSLRIIRQRQAGGRRAKKINENSKHKRVAVIVPTKVTRQIRDEFIRN